MRGCRSAARSRSTTSRSRSSRRGICGFLIVFRARLEGFLISDYASRFPEGLQRLGGWLADGTLRYREDVTEGLENAPAAFVGMLRGENRGKTLVKLR